MWDNIYHESLDSSVAGKHELQLKILSVKEIFCYCKKKENDFESFFQISV